MTVTISKPAINIREKLTEASAVVPYEQRQFHFDNLVTNGTFDTDTSGWTSGNSAVLSIDTQRLKIENGAGISSYAYQPITVTAGRTYVIEFTTSGGTAASYKRVGTAPDGATLYSDFANSTATATVTPATNLIYVTVGCNSTTTGMYAFADNISVYEADPSDNKTIHTMPKGWKPLHVYEDGALQREGSAYDYTVEYDGFNYIVKETVAPVAPYSTTVIGVRA